MQQGMLIIVSGPSGSGKGTLCAELIRRRPDMKISVSATTRTPRPGELHGINYFFLSPDEFDKLIEADGFLEWAAIYSYKYGTPVGPVKDMLARGIDIILEIDVQGGLQIREKYPDAILVFITTPSRQELERRLRGRGTDEAGEIEVRLEWAGSELVQAARYDYLVINDEVENAVHKLECIVEAERCRPRRIVIPGWISY
ncbi:MAG: guanylate kinase [Peptococcaceae bacterium BRH_c4b]|nr:MAG: guanylate kinase [Peptococcaceae bacterium BRH_c4b]